MNENMDFVHFYKVRNHNLYCISNRRKYDCISNCLEISCFPLSEAL